MEAELVARPSAAVIARALPPDVPEMEVLVNRCTAAIRAEGIEQWDELYPTRSTLERDVEAGSAYVCRLASALAGMYVVNTDQDPEYGDVPWEYRAGCAHVVHRLMIDPAHARLLMHDAEARAVGLGADVMRLDAFDQNPRACALYVRLGYRHAGNVRFRKGEFRCFEKRLTAAG